ncbi:MAG TPA: L17 family ribosomal protein [Planctomycetaceae bacterium]
MRHRMKGRKLGRNSSHRKALFKNMATSLILSVRPDEDEPGAPKVPGRIVTTLAKAKELRPQVEKLVTMARKARVHELKAAEFETKAARGTDEWRKWREGDQWQQWANAKAPAVAFRRRAFSILRSKQAVQILFDELAERFENRQGGYTRIVRLPARRLGDAGQKAILEFTGERDRPRSTRAKAPVVKREQPAAAEPQPAAPEKQENAEG